MHQTFYIDIDEEITSIVDRLRKARANEVIIVVPKRALLIQSIVNLRLLKKEAEKHGKEIVIVTQDKLGKMVVEKAEIPVLQRLDEIDGEEVNYEGEEIPTEVLNYNFSGSAKKDDSRKPEEIGTSDYFDAHKINRTPQEPVKLRSVIGRVENEKIINKELVVEISDKKKRPSARKTASMDIVRGSRNRKKMSAEEAYAENFPKEKRAVRSSQAGFRKEIIGHEEAREQMGAENFFDEKEEKLHDFFTNSRQNANLYDYSEKEHLKVNLSGKIWKFFFVLVIIVVILGGGFFAYLFLPKAEIIISVKSKIQEVSLDVKGKTSQDAVDLANETIPIKTVSLDVNINRDYATSGSVAGTNQKAYGTITIYNEYSSNPQPLVATTRFASSSGKIFRLVKGVTVPGTTNVNGEIKPGAIEAEVIADQTGADYNLDPTTFTIPGFQGSGNDKFTKFYAKSFKAMTGGGSGQNGISKAVSKEDIANAKSKALADLQQAARDKAKEVAQNGERIIEESVSLGEPNYKLSSAEGDVAEKISIEASVTANVWVISEEDIKKLVAGEIEKQTGNKDEIKNDSVTLQFGKVETDLANGNAAFRVDASVSIKSGLDIENLKRGILGKKGGDVEAYLKTFPEIESAEVKYWPSFINGQIPAYEQRVSIVLDSGQ